MSEQSILCDMDFRMSKIKRGSWCLAAFINIIIICFGSPILECNNVHPNDLSTVICTCKNNNGDIQWFKDGVQLTSCFISNERCYSKQGYNFSVNSSTFIFGINFDSYLYTSCSNISCMDSTSLSTGLQHIRVGDFNSSASVSINEPSLQHNDGNINVTTDCIYNVMTEDIYVEWLAVAKDGKTHKFEMSNAIIQETGACQYCGDDFATKYYIGFYHREETENKIEAHIQLKVNHNGFPSYPELKFTTSGLYYVKVKSSSKTATGKKIGAIIGGSIAGGVVVCLIIIIIVWKYYDKKRKVAPDTPRDFHFDAKSVTKDSVMLVWKQGQKGGSDQTFILSWHSEGDKERTKIIQQSSEIEKRHLLEGLSESKCYTVKICAVNSAGKSQIANPIHITTLGNPESPRNFRYDPESVTSDSVKLLWKQGQNGGCKQKFVVTWHSDEENEKSRIIPESKKHDDIEFLLKGLSDAKKYTVKIFSENSVGKSQESKPINIQTLGKPETPRDFRYDPESVTSDSVKLLWKQGQNGGCKQKFVVTWHSDEENEKSRIIPESKKHDDIEFLLKGLSDAKKYTVKIFSENSVGKSQESKPINIQTLGKPETPIDFRYDPESVTSDSVKLLWKQGQNGGCKQRFVLTWHSDEENEKSKTIPESKKHDDIEFLLKGLSDAKQYTVKICSVNSVGKSPEANLIHVRTVGPLDTSSEVQVVEKELQKTNVTIK